MARAAEAPTGACAPVAAQGVLRIRRARLVLLQHVHSTVALCIAREHVAAGAKVARVEVRVARVVGEVALVLVEEVQGSLRVLDL